MAPQVVHDQYTYKIGIITALPIERAAMIAMLDERHAEPTGFIQTSQDPNAYTWGRVGEHNLVITSLAAGVYGTTMATTTALPMLSSFPSIKFGLMVGIGAGVPNKIQDIRLGDVVVSHPSGTSGGVFQYDLGKSTKDSWERKDHLAKPPEILLKALAYLQSEHELESYRALGFLKDAAARNKKWGQSYGYPEGFPDRLFVSSYNHEGEDCDSCDANQEIKRKTRNSQDFEIHYGTIASGNSLVKNARDRDRIAKLETQCICIEMEAAGLMNNFPCLVIRGICDYGDSHKNDTWQRYASATAAAFAKELLGYVPKGEVQAARKAADFIDKSPGGLDHQPKHTSQMDKNDKIEQLLSKLLKSSYKEQKDRNSERVEGTCNWFTNHQLFKQWLSSNSFNLLWVSADPGCGKSVLARYLVDKVLPAPDRIVCYFFFKDEQVDQKTSTNAFCAFLHQLITQERHSLDPSLLDNLTRSDFSMTNSFDELWQACISIISTIEAQEVVFVLDALDECEEGDRKQLFHAFGTLDVNKSAKLKLLMTGRPYDDLKREFRIMHRSLPTIHLAGEDEVEVEKISREVDIVTDYRVEELGIEKCLEPAEVTFLQDKLRSILNRTYLWVTLVIDVIKKTPGFTRGNVHAVIRTLPISVDDAYEKILSRSSNESQARKLLSMVLVAKRPLLVEEINIASVIAEHHKSLDDLEEYLEPISRAKTTIRHICGLFVTIVNSRLYLLHQTARDFLIHKMETVNESSNSEKAKHKRRRLAVWKATILLPEAHNILAQSCVWYLNLATEPPETTTFFEYAAVNWMGHIREAQSACNGLIIKMAATFCSSTSLAPKPWSVIYCRTDIFFDARFHGATNRCTDLMVASYFGLVQVAKYLIDSDSNVDAVDIYRVTALGWAVREKHAPIVSLLLERGANFHLRDIQGRKAVDWAISAEDVAMIKVCLEEYIQNQTHHGGIYPEETNKDEPRSYIGLVKDHASLVYLLDNVPELHPISQQLFIVWHYDPINDHSLLSTSSHDLMLAAGNGHQGIVRSLLDRGADSDLPSENGMTALMHAAQDGHSYIVDLLLERGAAINLCGADRRTALTYAAVNGRLDIVRMLLDRGADVNIANNMGDTPLLSASRIGNSEIVGLLGTHGADFNHTNHSGWTALMVAALGGHSKVVALLLEQAVNVNHANRSGETALIVAVSGDHTDIVEQLLKQAVNVNHTTLQGETALMVAALRGNSEVVTVLLKHDANPHISNHIGRTALDYTLAWCHRDTAKLLQDRLGTSEIGRRRFFPVLLPHHQ